MQRDICWKANASAYPSISYPEESHICPALITPDVSVKVDIANLSGTRLNVRGAAGSVTFDVKAKLDEKERKSQLVVVGFGLLLTTKPYVLKLEVEGTATLAGKDADIRKMLEIDAETKVPPVLQRVYQHAFTGLYLLSTLLNAPAPPPDLICSQKSNGPAAEVNVEVAAEPTKSVDGVTIQADTGNVEPAKTTAT